MNEREEQNVRNHLRQIRALFSGLVNEEGSLVSSLHCRALSGIAHVDQASDELDAMREREAEVRLAWRREMETAAEELF